MYRPEVRKPRHVLVVGAGLAGLAAARRIARAGVRVTLLDQRAEPGGRLAGARVEGHALEPGPLLIGAGDRRLCAWIGELGLRDELLPPRPVVTAFAERDGLADLELRSFGDVARIPGVRRRHAWRLVRLPRLLARYGPALGFGAAAEAETLDDRSLADFARLYFGRSVLERWIAPLACAVSSGDPFEMSRVHFLQLLAHQGLARPGVLRGAFADVLERAAQGLEIVSACGVERLESAADGRLLALAADGRSFAGDAAVVATPAPVAASIADALLVSAERRFLGGVAYAPSLVFSAALCRPLGSRPRLVAPPLDSEVPLASLLVEPGQRGERAPAGAGIATLRARGGFAADHLETPDEAIEKELLAGAARLWPALARSVEFGRLFRERHGTPRFDVGHFRGLARFRRVQDDRLAQGRRIAFAGDYLLHPSPEGALRSGENAADSLLTP